MQLSSAEALDRLYRPEALVVPVLVARDGPIAALDPNSFGALAETPPLIPVLATAKAAPQAGDQPPVQVGEPP
ncbi:MAG: DUF4115 domain-containing protein, partial [Halocynthiibacter sp.]